MTKLERIPGNYKWHCLGDRKFLYVHGGTKRIVASIKITSEGYRGCDGKYHERPLAFMATFNPHRADSVALGWWVDEGAAKYAVEAHMGLRERRIEL